jgi:hypothetical protein
MTILYLFIIWVLFICVVFSRRMEEKSLFCLSVFDS